MGRRPTKPDAVPRLRIRKKACGKVLYYYDHGGTPRRAEPLGSDYGLAIKRWAEIERETVEKPASVITFRYVADRYRAEVMPTKSPASQRDNKVQLKQLTMFFDDPPCPLEAIVPNSVSAYLKWRVAAPVRANREKALLSHIWNYARREGYTNLANPCAGIKGYVEDGRDAYIEDAVFAKVKANGSQALRDAMDLAYLAGQRVTDTRLMDQRDIREGFLHVKQAKTGAKRRIAITGELAELLARVAARKATYKVHSTRLIIDEMGRPLSAWMMRTAFNKAREKSGIAPLDFQFRDLRAKAGTDKADSSDIRDAQQLLGHTSVVMTEAYVRNRKGSKATPTR